MRLRGGCRKTRFVISSFSSCAARLQYADETFSLTQLDPAEYTCMVYLSVLLCALAKKHNRKLRSTRKPTCAHRRKSILVANESCIFPFGAAALGMLGNRQLSNKKPRFRQVLTWLTFCAPLVECHGPVHVAIDGGRHGRHFVLTSVCHPYLQSFTMINSAFT